MRLYRLLLLLLPLTGLHAQRTALPNTHFTIRDGLAQQQVRCFFEDSRGYLWIGTRGGISRFDGYTLTPYAPQNGFPGRPVYMFSEAPDGALWYRSGDNVYRFDGQTDSLLPMTPKFWQQQPEYLWPLIMHRFQELLGERFPELSKFAPESVVFTDTAGSVLFADPISHTLVRVYQGKLEHLPPLPRDPHSDIAVDKNMHFYYGKNTCYAWVNDRMVLVAVFDEVAGQPKVLHPMAPAVYNHHDVSDVSYWYRTDGVYRRFEPEAFNRVDALFQDRLGRLYVATDEGFALVYPKGPETVRVPGARYPWSVHPAGDGGVYLSSYLDGLFYVNPETNTIRKYSLPSNDGKQHQLFPGKTTGPDGTPVFGGFRGVYFFYNDRLHLEPYGESIEAMAYDTLYERFLFAGKNLYVFDGSYPKTIYQSALPEALLQGDPCTDIDAAPDGSFWISGKGGVAFFSNKFELQHLYKLDAGVGLHAEVHCLATDAQGTLWAGGNVGVYRFQKTSNRWIRAFPGAVNAPVNDLVLLPENRMALLTDRSVVVVKTGDQPTITAIFDQSNGFTLLEPSENGACFDGRYLWVPAGNGLQRINLEVLGAGSASPAVRIDKINGRWMPFNVSVSDGVSDRAVLELSFIHLPPGSCEVWYRLGTEAWQEAAPGKRLEVEGLKHGVNTVQVQLRVRGNTLAETSCRITTNLPPLQRPGLRLLLGLALLAFVSALGFRIWQQRRLQSNLYQTQLRTVQAQLNPHVLFNLLSSLQNAIFNRTKEEASANLLRMSGMMREILEFSMPAEMETGKPFATITLAREIQFLDNFLTLEAMQTNPPFLFSIKNNIQLPADQVLLPPMLVQPLVENAVLHGIRPMRDRQGMIEVTFEQQDRRMIVRVEDNGKGPKQHPEPEVSSLRYRSRGGALLKERLLLIEKLGYRSTLTIEPREGGGTTATIQLENML